MALLSNPTVVKLRAAKLCREKNFICGPSHSLPAYNLEPIKNVILIINGGINYMLYEGKIYDNIIIPSHLSPFREENIVYLRPSQYGKETLRFLTILKLIA